MPTIIDVAKEAGVSFKTVSRVFSGEASVRPKTRAKVLAAAQSIGYTPNLAARALRLKAPRRVGLLIDNPSKSYSESTQIGAMLAAQGFGIQLVMGKTLDEVMQAGPLAGCLLAPPLANRMDTLQQLEDANVPYVRIGAERVSRLGDKIGIDDRKATADMTRYLIGLGHVDIAYIAGDPKYDVSRRRLEGFKDAMSDAALPVLDKRVATGDFSYSSGLVAAEALLSDADQPTAVFAANDEMASACLAVAYRLGLRVPDVLSVVGFDDAPVSRVIYPQLTTVRQGTSDMVGKAFAMLSERMNGADMALQDEIFPHSLIPRESTSAPPKATHRD